METIRVSFMGYLKRIEVRAENWDEMVKYFEARTQRHIDLVKKYLHKIMDLNLPDVSNLILTQELDHDTGKWIAPERDPYIYTLNAYLLGNDKLYRIQTK